MENINWFDIAYITIVILAGICLFIWFVEVNSVEHFMKEMDKVHDEYIHKRTKRVLKKQLKVLKDIRIYCFFKQDCKNCVYRSEECDCIFIGHLPHGWEIEEFEKKLNKK